MDCLALIRQFLTDRLGTDALRVTPEANLRDLGVDSLLMLDLVFEMEEQLGISLTRDTITPKTVGDLIATLSKRRAAAWP